AWKPSGTERFGNMAERRYGPAQKLRARAAEKSFGRKDGATALDMRSPGGEIEKDRDAAQAEQSDEDEVELRSYGVQEQNTIARFEICSFELGGGTGGGEIQFTKTIRAVTISTNIHDGGSVTQLGS